MLKPVPVCDFLTSKSPIIDVRSPSEFAQAHIPGATNIPLFSDAERAIVGTVYKEQGHDAAVLEGLRFVGPKMAPIAEQARDLAPAGRVRLHCWRGGERSGSTAWLLVKAGFGEVLVLTGGYKAYRNHVLNELSKPMDLRIMGGYTGTGKTEVLALLGQLGQQTIDLEALANHKGSSYGAIGEEPQPSTEQFENLLLNAIGGLDTEKPIWLEDESQMIGRVKIPDPFFARMRSAFCFFADMSMEDRALRLVSDYGKYPKELLAHATRRIEKRLGPQHCKRALEALDAGDLHTVAMITLSYYDKTYLHGLGKRDPNMVARTPASANDLLAIARSAIATDGERH